MPSDIVERLRQYDWLGEVPSLYVLAHDAIGEIVRLRGRVAELETALQFIADQCVDETGEYAAFAAWAKEHARKAINAAQAAGGEQMTLDEALAIVRDEAAFCRETGQQCQTMTDRKDDYAAFLLRKTEAQEMVIAEIERLTQQLASATEAARYAVTRLRGASVHGWPLSDDLIRLVADICQRWPWAEVGGAAMIGQALTEMDAAAVAQKRPAT